MTDTASKQLNYASRIAIAVVLCAAVGAGGVFARRRQAVPATSDVLAQTLMEVRGEMCSGRNLKGTGAKMEVFASSDLSKKALQSGLVPVLDLNVTPSAPVAAGQTVRWSGWLKGPESGKHRFHLPPGVSGQLTLSKAVILDPSVPSADTSGIALEEARFYPFTLVVTVDKAAIEAGTWLLSWAHPSEAPRPVTRGYLFPPTGPVAVVVTGPLTVASR